jgi:hypothetical protein
VIITSTAANERAAKLKTQESIDAAVVASSMEGKAAAQQMAVEDLKKLFAVPCGAVAPSVQSFRIS